MALLVLLTGGLAALAIAADLAAAAFVWGPAYAWRLIFWRKPNPIDGQRFPARQCAASSNPVHFTSDPSGPQQVRAAFSPLLPRAVTLEQFLVTSETTSLLVLRGDRLLYEAYFNGQQRDRPATSFSMAKSVISLLFGMALAQGKCPSLDTPADTILRDVPALRNGATIRQIMNMTPGFAHHSARPFKAFSVPWTDDKLTYFSPDLRRVARAVQPEYPPGTHFFYDDRNAMLIGLMLEKQLGENVTSFLQQYLWDPMGAEFLASWNLDSNSSGFEKMESGLNASPIDFLKIGTLVLRGGLNERGERVVPASWIEAISTPMPQKPGSSGPPDQFYTLFWWGFRRPKGPPDIFAYGIFGQVLLVSRKNDVVILRTGTNEEAAAWPLLLHAAADHLSSS